MAQSKIKVKIVEFVNNLLPSKPTQFKPALQTPTVVAAEKFIENIAKETGLSKFQANNVLSCIFQTAGDYMELGNAVQLHEDFGTLKPYLKVKATNTKEDCKADCITGMGLRLIPTGKMRDILGKSQFVFTGMSSGSDVEDSEVVTPNDPNGGGGTGGTTILPSEGVTIKWRDHANTLVKEITIETDSELTEADIPQAQEGYHWNFTLEDLNLAIGMKQPGDTVTVREQAD